MLPVATAAAPPLPQQPPNAAAVTVATSTRTVNAAHRLAGSLYSALPESLLQCLGPVCVPVHLLLAFLVGVAHQHGWLMWFKVRRPSSPVHSRPISVPCSRAKLSALLLRSISVDILPPACQLTAGLPSTHHLHCPPTTQRPTNTLGPFPVYPLLFLQREWVMWSWWRQQFNR